MTIFSETLENLKRRNFSFFTADNYYRINEAITQITFEYQFGEELPQDYCELRQWVYKRIARDIKYQGTADIYDHFCLGFLWGVFMNADLSTGGEYYWIGVLDNV